MERPSPLTPPSLEEKLAILRRYLHQQGFKATRQRLLIAQAFLETEEHVSAEELYHIVRQRGERIGLATVYRTLHLLCQCGLAQERHFQGGIVRYEQLYGRHHHDHLICIQCGRIEEFVNPLIEQLQLEVFWERDFLVEGHRLELYGICRECREAVG